ncbi:MAG: hypothetical protein IKY23_01620 [Lachnospiraceae bacterium]|nr:hypothetical protein [Lachnospiraceae bacterium]
MIFTLYSEDTNRERDIKVNPEQKIGETISILMDGGVLPHTRIDCVNLFSERAGRYLDLEKTYQQEQIYQGDILHIETENKE